MVLNLDVIQAVVAMNTDSKPNLFNTMSNKVVYISEQQEKDLIRKIMSESVVVNSNQVSEIVNLLNSCFQPTINHTGDVGMNGLPCPTLEIAYVVNGQPVQSLKKGDVIDVLNANPKFRGFVKDEPSRLAYFNRIVDDWLAHKVKLTGQLTVNVIDDKEIDKYKKKNKDKKDNE